MGYCCYRYHRHFFSFFQLYNVLIRYMVGLRSFTSDDMSGITDMGSTSVPISGIKVPNKYSLFIRFTVFQTPTIDVGCIDQLVIISGYDRIISLRLEVSAHETSLNTPLFMKVSAICQESKWSCIFVLGVFSFLSTFHDVAIGLCVRGIQFAFLPSTMLLLDFETFPTVWYFLLFILLNQ